MDRDIAALCSEPKFSRRSDYKTFPALHSGRKRRSACSTARLPQLNGREAIHLRHTFVQLHCIGSGNELLTGRFVLRQLQLGVAGALRCAKVRAGSTETSWSGASEGLGSISSRFRLKAERPCSSVCGRYWLRTSRNNACQWGTHRISSSRTSLNFGWCVQWRPLPGSWGVIAARGWTHRWKSRNFRRRA